MFVVSCLLVMCVVFVVVCIIVLFRVPICLKRGVCVFIIVFGCVCVSVFFSLLVCVCLRHLCVIIRVIRIRRRVCRGGHYY